MRGRIAAACAAVLVGLSPAVPLSSFAVAAACATVDAGVSAPSGAPAGSANELPASALSRSGRSACRPEGERAPSIWRDPSAPAPSQAPPAV